MIKNIKGFTLIELLAVIVILAVVALIASPIILGIVEDSRVSANVRSVERYAEVVRNTILTYMTINKLDDTVDICVGDGPASINCEVDATVMGRNSNTHTGGLANGRAVNYSGTSVSCGNYSYSTEKDLFKLEDCKVGNSSGLYGYDSTNGAYKQ